jgi:hypothetical protein
MVSERLLANRRGRSLRRSRALGLGWRVDCEPIAVDRGAAAIVDDRWEPWTIYRLTPHRLGHVGLAEAVPDVGCVLVQTGVASAFESLQEASR